MRAIVVGGGIGGLTAALALHRMGIKVAVLEQADDVTEVGAGIQLGGNGTVVLQKLGLGSALAATAIAPASYDYRELETGNMLVSWPLGADATRRYGAPLYNIHRADLIDLLRRALPTGTVHVASKVASFAQDASAVHATLATGQTLDADVLIGADGIHSVVRKQLRGDESTQFSNILMWRSLVSAEAVESLHLEERGNYWTGPGRTIISYWVRPRKLYSILASVPAAEVHRESWTDSGDVEDLLRSFHGAEPRVMKMLEAVETSFITGMYYRDPIDRWTYGRATLLGDAAHAMVPFLAQGACQAIEDAWVLATCLSRVDIAGVPMALKEYEERRRPRTTRVQVAARAMAKLVHESNAQRIRARNGRWKGLARIDPLGETTWGFVWGYDVLQAVDEPAGNVLGLTALREGKRMQRPESQRALELWKGAFPQEDIARGHDGMREAYDRFLLANFPPAQDMRVDDIELGGVRALHVRPELRTDSSPIALHFHGGGYMIGSAKGSAEYAGRIASAIDGDCISVDYRLAPESPFPAALDDAIDAYRGLLPAACLRRASY